MTHKHTPRPRGMILGLPRAEMLNPVRMLIAEWQSAEVMRWVFQLPTRVEGFELLAPLVGDLQSVLVGLSEQLAFIDGQSTPVQGIAQFHRAGALLSSPDEGWKVGPLLLETLRPGAMLTVKIVGFTGQLRPFGCQAGDGPPDPGVEK
ncbi:MAG TPA: hypothetical protein VNO55_31670 [Polyangia bacterium]|nr:hypothetical protein [Polyangia bacterium]